MRLTNLPPLKKQTKDEVAIRPPAHVKCIRLGSVRPRHPRGYPLTKSGVHHKIKSGQVRLDPT